MTVRYPDFYIVGAAKCGTTSIFNYLGQHPAIFSPAEKEPNYFATDLFPRGYINKKDYLSLFYKTGLSQITGEASTSYLYSKVAAANISKCRPDAKIIIILRNPVDMMYSLHGEHYFHNLDNITDFSEALDAEPRRKKGMDIPGNIYQPSFLFYRERAHYCEQIQRYLDTFSKEQIFIVLLDDIKNDADSTYRDLLIFLGVNPEFVANFNAVNKSKTYRNSFLHHLLAQPRWLLSLGRKILPFRARRRLLKSILELNLKEEQRVPIDPELRLRLTEEFSTEIHKLENVLGRDLSHWLATD